MKSYIWNNLFMSLYIKKAFDITKENIILAQPLIIFLIVISFTFAGLAQQTNKILHLIFLTGNVLLCTAFLAGWFYMIKKGIEHNKKAENNEYKNNQEKAAASFALGKEFFPGVGEYFLGITYTTLVYLVVYALLIFVCYKAGTHYLPNPNIDMEKFMAAASSTPAEMQKYVYSLSFEQLTAINIWMLFVGGVATIFTFLTMFLYPAVFDKKEKGINVFLTPFSAFNRNIVFIFKHFFGSLGIMIFLFFLNMFVSILSLIFNINIILAIVGLIISFYFMTYAIVLIFLYYEENK